MGSIRIQVISMIDEKNKMLLDKLAIKIAEGLNAYEKRKKEDPAGRHP